MTTEIPLTQGQVALIDDGDYERINQYKWWAQKDSRTGKFYAMGWVNGNRVLLHRFIMDAPPGTEVDHIDGNGLNCQRDNLRLASHLNNMRNRGKGNNNTSGYKGVSPYKRDENYLAHINVDGVKHNLGYFDTAEEAALVHDDAARKYHGEFANLNFPERWLWNAVEKKWQSTRIESDMNHGKSILYQ